MAGVAWKSIILDAMALVSICMSDQRQPVAGATSRVMEKVAGLCADSAKDKVGGKLIYLMVLVPLIPFHT